MRSVRITQLELFSSSMKQTDGSLLPVTFLYIEVKLLNCQNWMLNNYFAFYSLFA